MEQEVFILDVLKDIIEDMIVPVVGSNPASYYTINYEPGKNSQIIASLKRKDGTSEDSLKYPLIAVKLPILEKHGSGFLEVTFPEIVFAYLTKTSEGYELVMDKYSSDGVFKTILRPCQREFIKQLAFSTYTNMGDPDAYDYSIEDSPFQQKAGEGLTDFVDISRILNLKATFFDKIKTC